MPRVFAALRGLVRVVVDDKETYVLVLQGQELPEHLADEEVQRLDDLRALVPEDGGQAETPAEVDLPTRQSSDDELARWITTALPTGEQVVAEAGSDKIFAGRLLEAEKAATGGQPRQDVVTGLEQIIKG